MLFNDTAVGFDPILNMSQLNATANQCSEGHAQWLLPKKKNTADATQEINTQAPEEILTGMSLSYLSDPSTENAQPTNERAVHEAVVDSPSTDLAESEAAL